MSAIIGMHKIIDRTTVAAMAYKGVRIKQEDDWISN